MIKKIAFPFIVMFWGCSCLLAQQISGVVKDDTGELPGVSVIVKGTTVGVVTDVTGEYTIQLPVGLENPVLVFSYMGYEKQEVPVAGKAVIHVQLKPETQDLDEVVVIAYGTHKKSDLSSSISVLSAEDIAKVPVTEVGQAIQGKIPGVTVLGSGMPGQSASIRIRGVGTINSTEPLTVVDGNPGAPMPDANDIESFQVLKDAAACALYGARGSNGVILITTKKGSKGKTSISYNGYYGWQWVKKKLDLLSASEYIRFHQENMEINNLGGKYANGWMSLSPRILQAINDPASMNDTDWQDAIFQLAPMTKHSVSISNGGENGNFFFSGSYLNQDGIQIESKYEKFNFQINSSAKLGPVTVGEHLNVYSSTQNNATTLIASSQSPLVPIYNEENLGGFDGATDALDLINVQNPVALAHLNPSLAKRDGLSGNVFLDVHFLKDFTYRGNVATRIVNSSSTAKALSAVFGAISRPYTSMTLSNGRSFATAVENTLTYDKYVGRHHINAMVGYTLEYSKYSSSTATGDKFNVRVPVSFKTLASDASKSLSGSFYETTMESILARVMYDYAGRYLFTVNFRRDGSSKFGVNYRYGNFPSFSLGWRLSEEQFMKDAKKYVDNLKLRASWGIIGSDFGIDAYNQEIALNQALKYVFGDDVAPSTTTTTIVNEDLRWEEQKTLDVGLDLDMFGGKFSMIADYFYKETDGMLIDVPIAYSNGISNMLMNAGNVDNHGVELAFVGRKNTGEFTCEGTFNLTFERNIVKKLGHIDQPITGGVTSNFKEGVTRTEVGHAIGQFYGYKMLGIYQIGDEDIPEDLSPGDIRFDDMVDGKPGLTEDDRTYIGSPFPELTYNFGFNAGYKGFDFSFFFQGIYGMSVFNESLYVLEGMKDFHGQSARVLKRWTPQNPSTTIPRATQNSTHNLRISDRFVEDASYLRLKSLSLGYTIPKNALSKLHIQKLRVYVSGQNLLTFTNYSGYDPEIFKGKDYTSQESKSPNLYRGIDKNNYPLPASFFVGLEVNF